METKRCSGQCNLVLPLGGFAKGRAKCKKCRALERKEYLLLQGVRPRDSHFGPCKGCGVDRGVGKFGSPGAHRCYACVKARATERKRTEGKLNRRVSVPIEPVSRIACSWIRASSGHEWKPVGGNINPCIDAINDLSESSGLSKDFIYRVLSKKRKSVSFDSADRIITATDRNEEWHTDPVLQAIKL